MPRKPGLFAGIISNPKPIVVDVPMQSYVLNDKGAFTVTLPDGQVWEQLAEDEVYHPARWRKPAPELLVTISPGPMRTFTMMVAGEQRVYKVRRLR